MQVPDKLKNEIWDYCRANDITDVEGFMVRLLERGFSVEKYGEAPGEENKEETEMAEDKTPKQEGTKNEDSNENEELKQQLIESQNRVAQLEQKLLELTDKLDKGNEDKKEEENKRDIYGDDDPYTGPATHGSNPYDDIK